jgi:hypothetical protein
MKNIFWFSAIATLSLSSFNLAAYTVEHPSTRSSQILPSRTVDQASELAQAFVTSQKNQYGDWLNASINTITPLYDGLGQTQGYEVDIIDNKLQPLGYMIVEAVNNGINIAEYSMTGEAPSKILIKEYEQKTGENIDPLHFDVSMLWNGPGTSALRAFDSNSAAHFIAINPQQTFSDLTRVRQFPSLSTNQIHINTNTNKRNPDMAEQNELLHMPTKLSITPSVIDWSFTPFDQEHRTWTNSTSDTNTCYAGCTPIAAAMLIDFYDRNGFPHMIGDETQQVHHTSSALMRETIDVLRGALKTYCREDGQGGTSQANSVKLVDYMNTRQEQQFSSRRISYATMTTYVYLTREIKAQRPAIVHYHTQGTIGTNHSAIAYGYQYGGTWADNFLKVRTGWSRQPEINYNIKSMGTVEATLVSLKD